MFLCHNVPLTEIPKISIDNAYNISFKNNNLRFIPSRAFETVKTALYHLQIVDNSVTSFPSDALDGLSSLRTLDLRRNQLVYIRKDSFKTLRYLEKLYLDNNWLYKFDESFFDYWSTKVEILTLANNRITSLKKDAFEDLRHCEYLNLENNPVQELAQFTFQYSMVQHINLRNTSLTRLNDGDFSTTRSLTDLNLTSNYLTRLPTIAFSTPRSAATRLQRLDVRDNNIAAIELKIFDELYYMESIKSEGNLIVCNKNLTSCSCNPSHSDYKAGYVSVRVNGWVGCGDPKWDPSVTVTTTTVTRVTDTISTSGSTSGSTSMTAPGVTTTIPRTITSTLTSMSTRTNARTIGDTTDPSRTRAATTTTRTSTFRSVVTSSSITTQPTTTTKPKSHIVTKSAPTSVDTVSTIRTTSSPRNTNPKFTNTPASTSPSVHIDITYTATDTTTTATDVSTTSTQMVVTLTATDTTTTDTSEPAVSLSDGSSKGTSQGTFIGIILALVVVLILVGIYVVWSRKNKQVAEPQQVAVTRNTAYESQWAEPAEYEVVNYETVEPPRHDHEYEEPYEALNNPQLYGSNGEQRNVYDNTSPENIRQYDTVTNIQPQTDMSTYEMATQRGEPQRQEEDVYV
eukprot:m.310546 g.310546  ORF g.310546 m.310546 type:complete len:626 (-) comp16477_c3_seq1:28-1905(-)